MPSMIHQNLLRLLCMIKMKQIELHLKPRPSHSLQDKNFCLFLHGHNISSRSNFMIQVGKNLSIRASLNNVSQHALFEIMWHLETRP